MSDHSKIEWTDATWNPVIGCTKVSPGCDHCYAIRTAHRMSANPNATIAAAYGGTETDGDWTGRVNLLEDRLDQPLRWRRPRRIFVNSQSDLFHDQVPDLFIERVFAVMSLAPQHTFQVLTKRQGRMRSLLGRPDFEAHVRDVARAMKYGDGQSDPRMDDQNYATWPLPNVWLGVSVENQQWADIRIPALLETPAAVRFLSCEPLLGPVDMRWRVGLPRYDAPRLHWVIAGGESGPGARPMHPDWARSLRNQCVAAGIPFHFKQWGEWAPAPWGVDRLPGEGDNAYKARAEAVCATAVLTNPMPDGSWALYEPDYKPWSAESGGLPAEYACGPIRRVGKRAAGRELDGRTWDEFPMAVTR